MPTFTVPEFAKKIRDKYGSYDDKNDEELVNAFVQKYPVYKESIAQEPKPPENIALKAGLEAVKRQFTGAIPQVLTMPERGVRALGVGAEHILGTPRGQPVEYQQALERASEATKPNYQAQPGEKIGATLGEYIGSIPKWMFLETAAAPISIPAALALRSPVAGAAISTGLAAAGSSVLDQLSKEEHLNKLDVAVNGALGAIVGGGVRFIGDRYGIFAAPRVPEVAPRPTRTGLVPLEQPVTHYEIPQEILPTVAYFKDNPGASPSEASSLMAGSGIDPQVAQERAILASKVVRAVRAEMGDAQKAVLEEEAAKKLAEQIKAPGKPVLEPIQTAKVTPEQAKPPEQIAETPKPAETVPDAKFIGFQEDPDVPGGKYPIFNVTKPGHPLLNSTVMAETLQKEGLVVPEIMAKPEKTGIKSAKEAQKTGKFEIGGFQVSQLEDLSKNVSAIPAEDARPEDITVGSSPEKAIKLRQAGLISEKNTLTQSSISALREFERMKKLSEENFIENVGFVNVPKLTTKKILNNTDRQRSSLFAGIKLGWITDGRIMYRVEAQDKALADEYSRIAGDANPPNFNMVSEPTKKFTDEIVNILGIKSIPKQKSAAYLLESKGGQKIAVNAGYFDFLKARYPNAKIVSKNPNDPIAFIENNEVKAVLMSLREEPGEVMKIAPQEIERGGSRGAFKAGEEGPEIKSKSTEIPEGTRDLPSEQVLKGPEPSEKLAQMNIVRPMEMPEIVKLSKELMGHVPKVGKLRTNLGLFKGIGAGQIKLKPEIFKNADLAARVLTHEIGHLIDYLPEKTMKRGNLLGRLLSLQKFLKNTFDDLIVTNQTLRAELTSLSEWWRPFNKETASKSYIAYRKGGDELYADAISVLLNSPGTLKEKAPQFFEAFFKNLDNKPDVKAEYFGLQDFLAGSESSILEGRESDIRHGFARAEELSALKREQKELRDKRMWERTRQEYENIFYPILKKYQEALAKGKIISDEENPLYLLDEFSHHRINDHIFLNAIDNQVMKPAQEAGMTKDDLGLYLLFNRIINERTEIANPYGHTQATAQKGLDSLLESLGPEKTKILKDSLDKFHDLVFDRVKKAVDVGAYNKETFDTTIAPNKGNYATFAVTDYFVDQGFVTAAVRQQKGTLAEVMNPFTATTLKTLALNRLIAMQEAKNSVLALLKNNFPNEIEPAARLNPGDKIPLWKKKENRGVFEVLEDGHRKAYSIDPLIAKSFDKTSPGHLSILTDILGAINRGIFHPLYITFNPGFQAFNVQRDLRRTYKALTAQGVPVTIKSLLSEMLKAIPSAIRRERGINDELINKMLQDKALDLPAADVIFGDKPDEYQSILIKHGLIEKPNTAFEKIKKEPLLSPLVRLAEYVRFTGNVIESMAKIAGYNLRVKAGEKGKLLGYNTRNYTGTPNFRTKGLNTNLSNSVFMFSNIFIQGAKADAILATSPKTRSGYWYATTKLDLLPKFLMFLGASGILGKEIKDHYDRMTEYDKTNYITFPIGHVSGGLNGWKSVYVRLPHDESGRFISGLFWKMLNAFRGEEKKFQDVLSFGAGQLPNISPAINLADNWAEFLTGKNPYDSFRGRTLIPETEFKAGTWPSLKRMIEWTVNQTGFFQFANYDPSSRTTLETFFQAAPVANRIIKISDYGLQEQAKAAQGEKEAKRAQAKLGRGDFLTQLMADKNRLAISATTPEKKRELARYNKFYYQNLKTIKRINILADRGDTEQVKELNKALEERAKNFFQK